MIPQQIFPNMIQNNVGWRQMLNRGHVSGRLFLFGSENREMTDDGCCLLLIPNLLLLLFRHGIVCRVAGGGGGGVLS